MLTAMQKAETLPQAKKRDHEIRFLDAMPVYFFALWLHGKTDDIIVPLPPTYSRYEAYQAYSESDIIKLLKECAERTKKFGNIFLNKNR